MQGTAACAPRMDGLSRAGFSAAYAARTPRRVISPLENSMPVQSHTPMMDRPTIVRWRRRIRHVLNEPRLIALLTFGLWLGLVVIFALWTAHTYHPPGGPPWIGMTIHTTVFGIWTLAIREWLLLRLREQRNRWLSSRSALPDSAKDTTHGDEP